jgi:integrase
MRVSYQMASFNVRTHSLKIALAYSTYIRHNLDMSRSSEHSARELGSRSARQRLPIQARPYFTHLGSGLSLGYRRGQRGGTWIARAYDVERGYRFCPLGMANDVAESVGLSFQAAQDAAQAFYRDLGKADASGLSLARYTVAQAAEDWLANFKGSDRSKQTSAANVRNYILPILGAIELRKLTRQHVEKWLQGVAKQKPHKVIAREAAIKQLPPSRRSKLVYDPTDAETIRKRRDTANRIFNDLKAILNRAADNEVELSRNVWESVDKFQNVSIAKNEYLTLEEVQRFFAVCPTDFRNLVQAAVVTGCRYGELCTVRVSAYDPNIHALTILQSKTGKLKQVFLTEEEAKFFDTLCADKQGSEYMLLRADGKPWQKSHQQPRMRAMLKAAKIDRNVRFHDLRHTFATLMMMNGTSLQLVANQLGHSGTRIAEKHYAHFSPAFIASTVRANKPSFGV